MALATAGARTPSNRKSRESCSNSPRLSQITDNNSSNANNTAALRRQRLTAFGLSNIRADLVASLAWGALA